MNELDETAKLVMIAATIAAETGGEKQKQRSDTLAAAVQNMCGDGVDEGDAGVQIFADLVLDTIQLMAVSVPHVRHAVNG